LTVTPWRKEPEYQGGFLLDGGVHYTAAIRLLLGEDDPIVKVSAFSTQLQKHLPPVDTLSGVAQTKSGVCGTISISFGTTFQEDRYLIAYENGTIEVSYDEVKIKTADNSRTETLKSEDVRDEIASWAEGLTTGKLDKRQSWEEGLADLELLEALLQSGASGGVPSDRLAERA
jgi:predicted dehydrogenase